MFFNLSPFTKLHVMISLIGIVSGLVVMFRLLIGRKLNRWTALFLISTALTSVTGFFFSFHGVTPAIVVGIISLIVLAVAIFARYARHLAGHWRWIYAANGDDRALLQYLRVDRATFPEGARPESFGTNTDRAAICCHATGCVGAVCSADDYRRDQVSR